MSAPQPQYSNDVSLTLVSPGSGGRHFLFLHLTAFPASGCPFVISSDALTLHSLGRREGGGGGCDGEGVHSHS